ncbi:MAG: hypothetical protein K8F25_04945, partial [Fimbriimonadaceae bacterium]|nr:hypothetical protein [Alphaproteobacteria bacterium]
MGGLVLVGRLLQHLGHSGGALLRCNWHVLLMLAAWMTVLWVLLARRDVLIQLSMDHPLFPFQDI